MAKCNPSVKGVSNTADDISSSLEAIVSQVDDKMERFLSQKDYRDLKRMFNKKKTWEDVQDSFCIERELEIEDVKAAFIDMQRFDRAYQRVCRIVLSKSFQGLMSNNNGNTAISGIAQFYHDLQYHQCEKALVWLDYVMNGCPSSDHEMSEKTKPRQSEKLWSPRLIALYRTVIRVMEAMGPY